MLKEEPKKQKKNNILENKKDLTLIAKIKQGDNAARNKLIEKYDNLFRSVAIKYSKPYKHIDVDELTQVLRIAFDKNIDSFDETRGVFAAYVKRCIVNKAIDYLRTHKANDINKYDISIGTECTDPNLTPDKRAENVEDWEAFIKLLLAPLNDLESKIMELYCSYYSYQEISEMLNINKKQVDNALYQAKKKIKLKYPSGLSIK